LAYKGQTIYNSITGETLTFLETAADTNGEKLVFDLVLKPGSTVPMKHTTQSRMRYSGWSREVFILKLAPDISFLSLAKLL
jgi:hypothetical protein